MDRVDIIKALSERLPISSLGLPEGIYRADLLSPTIGSLGAHGGDEASDEAVSKVGAAPDETRDASDAQADGRVSDVDAVLPSDERFVAYKSYDSSIPDTGLEVIDVDADTGENNVTVNAFSAVSRRQAEESGKFLDVDLLQRLAAVGITHRTIQRAYIPVSCYEGFPALPDGRPLWSQFDFEPEDCFKAFWGYVEQGRVGARALFTLRDDMPDSVNGFGLPELESFSHLYFWHARARAYDMFSEALRRKQRALMAMEAEDSHFFMAERLLQIAEVYIGSEDFIEQMTPKHAIELLKLGSTLQRISLGLPGNGPSPTQKVDGDALNIDVTMRNIAKTAQTGEIVQRNADSGAALRRLLENEETAAMAQELVLRVRRGGE